MSREEPNFQEMFQQNMNQLQNIQNDIGRKLTEKSEFSRQILPQLVEINKQLVNVRDKFNLLKQQLSNLEREIADKDKGIADAGTACAGLQNEIQRLQQQLDVFGKEREELTNTVHSLGDENNEMKQYIAKQKQEDMFLEGSTERYEWKQNDKEIDNIISYANIQCSTIHKINLLTTTATTKQNK